MTARICLVTYDKLPELDPDDVLLKVALERRGGAVRAAVWNGDVDWSASQLTVLRSMWDYHERCEAFAAWVRTTAAVTRIVNAPDIVLWIAHKSYLLELERAGVPVVPTVLVRHGESPMVADVLRERGWKQAVVKPAAGGGTYRVLRVSQDAIAPAEAHLAALLADGDALVQPYLASVESYGERALVFVGGSYSHAVRKTAFQPLLPAGLAGEQPATASDEEIAVAQAACRAVGRELHYARVDLIRDERGRPRVIELELIEPSLFFAFRPAAAEALADRLCRDVLRAR